ncbi:NAD(P)H-dependent glycerol-3-phosphate dehydrogenase [Vulgatibacter incomptus]|uniref:Glycerol-3-phosphate dehydrogenase [NAD(P)+] n=1 Tax=Vulgatibacter incomptus TaxID=1391653 RepID=A0A0K1PFU2_9BACT|nr:NAD(P)H-dependent glycerol-3-phosphate dehydrogenase [Vulgatibacter incomptus]AKU92281.1 Glycerol-3-phosphate dehydrogenase [Vulgatibacter incomptus]
MRAAIIGAGGFGTSLAVVLGGKGIDVRLWVREPELCRAIGELRENRRYLPGIEIPSSVTPVDDLRRALEGAEMVVAATPSQVARSVFQEAAPLIPTGVPIVTVSKGIEEGTRLLPTEVLESVLPPPFHPYLAVLSGPSFAREVAAGSPTLVTVAAHWQRNAVVVQEAFTAPTFRCYTSTDVVGVQLGGALKNVIAIGSGIVDGLGFGNNARAALITRGLAEMARVAVARGANPITLSGLSGLGDLVLTCTGELSRNRRVGVELGRGRSLQEILGELGQVAEGVNTVRSARELAHGLGVEVPITDQVYAIIHEGKDPKRAAAELMARALKPEFRY